MVASVRRDSVGRADAQRRRAYWSPMAAATVILGAIVAALTANAMLQPTAPFDIELLRAVQAVELGTIEPVIRVVDALTSSTGAVIVWLIVLGLAVASRRWLASLAVLALPVGGVINHIIGEYLVGRTRPGHSGDFLRTVEDVEAASYPSGHVMGAVMLYGLLFYLAGRLRNRWLTLGVRAGSAVVLIGVGFGRVWYGAHWPSDVLGAYALGGLILLGIVAAHRRIDSVAGDLPFIRAVDLGEIAGHDRAHALTSTVYFDRDRVAKVYAPGFLPRAIYWLAFQAEFPYIRNRAALEAAVERRNLAGKLTEFWYGSNHVARAVGIEEIAGRPALVSERVEGHEPQVADAAKAFLKDLRARFEAAGLPTWQIDPRQPRAIDNVLQASDGRLVIVDLESGLVSPLASVRTWLRAFRRGMVPIYDDVYFDVTRAYVAEHREDMRAAMGESWLQDLNRAIDVAELAVRTWHAGEPRIWSRAVQRTIRVVVWPFGIRQHAAGGQERATAWLNGAVSRWDEERRLTGEQIATLRNQIASPEVQALLPHFGAHLAITVVLRFPFGSIARVAWSGYMLGVATARLLSRRIDRRAWKRAWQTHSPLVILLAAIPGFGAFAYLVAKPVRSNRLLLRVALDAVMLKIPKRLYERSGLRRMVVTPELAGEAQSEPARLSARDGARPEHKVPAHFMEWDVAAAYAPAYRSHKDHRREPAEHDLIT